MWIGKNFLLISTLAVTVGGCSSPQTIEGKGTPTAAPMLTLNRADLEGLTRQLERAIAQDLPQEIRVPIQSVTCPPQAKLEPGKVFDCTAQIAAGKFPVEVTVRNANGQITLKTRQILLLSEAEKLLQQSIQQRNRVPVTANCGGKVKVFQKVGEQFQCQLKTAAGKTGTATITVTKPEGKVKATWRL